mgnify:FL=1
MAEESLSKTALEVQESFINSLKIDKRKTIQPLVVALVGLVGSGKSSVAQKLAPLIGATVIGGDRIRVELRKRGEPYKHQVRAITEASARFVIKNGGSVIIDSDHADSNKRENIQEKVDEVGARLVFIRVHSDIDLAIGRIIHNNKKLGEFFEGASSKESSDYKPAVIKIKEMWRRTPFHYEWNAEKGGAWILKKLPIEFITDIDTSTTEWEKAVEDLSQTLLGF